MWKEAVVIYLKTLFRYSPEEIDDGHGNILNGI
jgi:hypothetical protein